MTVGSLRTRCWATLLLMAVSCAGAYDRSLIEASFSPDPETTATTPLGLQAAALREDESSAFRLLKTGRDAFLGRVLLLEAAEHSIDVQVYIFHGMTGTLLFDGMVAAADRGVRVRILIDDLGTGDKDDVLLAQLASHQNIEVRVFNPVRARSGIAWSMEALLEFDRVNRRMHNKMFIADAQACILGGRNIGDEYFDAGPVAFQDLDVLAFGEVAAEAATVFDDYWNSEWAIPASMVAGEDPQEESFASIRAALAVEVEKALETPYVEFLRGANLMQELQSGAINAIPGRGELIVDPPSKLARPVNEVNPADLRSRPELSSASAEKELLIVSPYFIPGSAGVDLLVSTAQSGVPVRVLTNSLAATDVSIVHVGYSPYRRSLLRGGVELYELKPLGDDGVARAGMGSSSASLHAKTFIFDRNRVFIGSLNLDPRSLAINTEGGVMIYCDQLAGDVAELIESWSAPDLAWRLRFDDGSLYWVDRDADGEIRETSSEPGKSFLTSLGQGVMGLLPLESQL